jgi:hypothetical protein
VAVRPPAEGALDIAPVVPPEFRGAAEVVAIGELERDAAGLEASGQPLSAAEAPGACSRKCSLLLGAVVFSQKFDSPGCLCSVSRSVPAALSHLLRSLCYGPLSVTSSLPTLRAAPGEREGAREVMEEAVPLRRAFLGPEPPALVRRCASRLRIPTLRPLYERVPGVQSVF